MRDEKKALPLKSKSAFQQSSAVSASYPSSLIPHPASLILGTAGHIDHGKTSLVKALTGIDADRLPEEKARGMTIDLGFAHLDLNGRRIGIVDVPGHERFIRNMVAGATGIDFVMLVVAADDAVMPQTREHLEIIDLLGVKGGLVALNKIDLASPVQIRRAEEEIHKLLKGSLLEDAPMIRVSAVTGEGVSTLRDAIFHLADNIPLPVWPPLFRLPIDRRFSIQGHGTVVTGSLLGGDVKAADEVELMPQRRRLRARSVESFGSDHDGLNSGRRVAINLPGIKAEEITRGDELATPGYLRSSLRFAVRLQWLNSAPLALSRRALFRIHIGTLSSDASITLIGSVELEPGQSGFAILQTSDPICAAYGQRFILRSPSYALTVGGGKVLCTNPPRLKSNTAIPDWFPKLDAGSGEDRLLAILELEPALGGDAKALYRETGVPPDDSERLLSKLAAAGKIQRSPGAKGSARASGFWTDSYIQQCREQILVRLRELLEKAHPRLSIEEPALLRANSALGPPEFIQWILAQLSSDKKIQLERGEARLPGYRIQLKESDAKLLENMLAVYRSAGLSPPTLDEVIVKTGLSRDKAKALFAHAIDAGELISIQPDLAMHLAGHDELIRILKDSLANGASRTVSELKDAFKVSRKYAIPICEYLDREGYTKRQGDSRVAGGKLKIQDFTG